MRSAHRPRRTEVPAAPGTHQPRPSSRLRRATGAPRAAWRPRLATRAQWLQTRSQRLQVHSPRPRGGRSRRRGSKSPVQLRPPATSSAPGPWRRSAQREPATSTQPAAQGPPGRHGACAQCGMSPGTGKPWRGHRHGGNPGARDGHNRPSRRLAICASASGSEWVVKARSAGAYERRGSISISGPPGMPWSTRRTDSIWRMRRTLSTAAWALSSTMQGHVAQALGQLRIFGDQLRVANRQGEVVGQVMLERASRETHAVQPRLIFQAGLFRRLSRLRASGAAPPFRTDLSTQRGWLIVAPALSQG